MLIVKSRTLLKLIFKVIEKLMKIKFFSLSLSSAIALTSLLFIFSLIGKNVNFELDAAKATIFIFLYNPFVAIFIVLLSLKLSGLID
jgi:hypothetical protein